MTDHEQAWAVVFNIKRIEQGVQSGDFKVINGVKVLDGTLVNGHFWVYYGALSNVELGDEIPAELYKAVAEVLIFVLRLSGRVR